MIHSQITIAGQAYNVSRDPRGQCFIGDETVHAFIERMSLLRRTDVLADLAAIGRAKIEGKPLMFDSPQQTAWALHQARTRNN